MATNENLIPIPGRLHSVASDEIVSGANEIYDDKLSDNLENLNTGFTNNIDTIYNTIGNNNEKGAIMEQLNTIDGRLDTIDGEISALNHIPIEVVQLNPSTGEPNVNNPQGDVLYRASNSDQTSYSDWMYKEDDHEWVMIFEQQTPSELEKLVGYYTCSTEANLPEKSIGDTGYVLPANGGAMKIKMTNANTANNATLKIGTEAAKTLLYNGKAVSAFNTWEENEVISVYFDGTNYQASNAQGNSNKKINTFLYSDLKTFAVGVNYSAKEPVITSDKQILRVTQDVRFLNLTDTVKQGELRTYNNATYQAQEDVKEFADTSLTGASVAEPVYALGSPTKLSLNIERGNCNIEAYFTNGTEIVGNKVNITPATGYTPTIIATAVYEALTALGDTGWTFTDKGNGSITAEYPATEGYSDYNIIFSESSGITSTPTVSVTDSSTKITMAFSVGIGNISATFNGITYNISVGASTTSSHIASSIAEAFSDIEGWNIENSGNVVSAICLKAGNNSSTEFKLTDGVLGVTYTLSKPWTGSNNISHYNGTDWTIDTLATYASSIVFANNETIDEAWLIANATEPDSLAKEIIEDEIVVANAFIKQQEDYNSKIVDDEYVIAKAVGDHEIRIRNLEGGDIDSKYSGTISVDNSDAISIFGSSYGAVLSNYVNPTSKHWVNILNLFSDYTIQNLSMDGISNAHHIIRLRKGQSVMLKSTRFALLVNNENLKGSIEQYFKSFLYLSKVVKSFGVQPIIGTSHNSYSYNQDGHYYSSLLREWCKKNHTLFMDAGEYCMINGMNTGAHPNVRQTASTAYAYMDALSGIESPRQSMKIYKVRSGVDTSNLDNLIFDDNYERARRFVPASTSTTFNNIALISVILPATSNYLDKVQLNISCSTSVNVYCMDSDMTPYPELTNYTRFHINEPCNVAEGDKYSYNGTMFTVVSVDTEDHYGEYCDLYCLPLISAEDVDGTLVKGSGSSSGSSSSINFNGHATASLNAASVIDQETGGHWTLLENDGKDRYNVSPMTEVFYDRLHFLIVSESSFTIKSMFVGWGASREKECIRQSIPDFTSNLLNPNTELITESTFGAGDTVLSSWTDENGQPITSVAGSSLPNGCSSYITLTSTGSMNCTVDKSKLRQGHLVMEILARNNIPTITTESWDWSLLKLTLSSPRAKTPYTVYSRPIGVSWRIVRIPLETIYRPSDGKQDMVIKISSEFDNMQIAKVSLKYI